MAQTTIFDVKRAEKELDRTTLQLAKHSASVGSRPTGEARQKLARLSEAVVKAQADYRQAKEEADFDAAVATAYAIGGERAEGSPDPVNAITLELSKALTECNSKVIVSPPTFKEAENFELTNFAPKRSRDADGLNVVEFQTQVSAPKELREKIFAPPASRTPQQHFSTSTASTNAPIGVDYYSGLLTQPGWSAGLHSPSVSNPYYTQHTQEVIVPSFSTRPTVSLFTTESTTITDVDPVPSGQVAEADLTFASRMTLDAYEFGAGTSLSEKSIQSNQDPMFVGSVWQQLQNSVNKQINSMFTAGTGLNQPTGVYTAAAGAYTDHRNRVQTDGNAAATANDGFNTLLEAYGLIGGDYRTSNRFFWSMNGEFASHLFATSGGGFATHDVYPWTDADPAPQGAIYAAPGGAILENEFLHKVDTTNNNRMGVCGAFDYFWVRHCPIIFQASKHNKAVQHETFVSILTWTDSIVSQWSADANSVGPFVYIQAAGN